MWLEENSGIQLSLPCISFMLPPSVNPWHFNPTMTPDLKRVL